MMIRTGVLQTRGGAARLSTTTRSATPHHRLATCTAARHQSTIVSRRQWKEYLTKSKPQLKVKETSAKNTTAESKPWPASVRYTGYTLAVTVVPYTAVWICLTNRSTRPLVLNYCGAATEQVLRQHFGQVDVDAVAYTDRHEQRPYMLLGEDTRAVRENETRIQAHLAQPVPVRLRLRDNDNDNMYTAETELPLPATQLARPDELLGQLHVDDKATLATSSLVVDFPVETPMKDESEEFSNAAEEPPVDPLRVEARVYSLWHYMPVAPQSHNNNNNVFSSQDDLDAARWRHEIARLQDELKQLSTSRPIDDITDELNRAKAELRRLQWKKWVPWS